MYYLKPTIMSTIYIFVWKPLKAGAMHVKGISYKALFFYKKKWNKLQVHKAFGEFVLA